MFKRTLTIAVLAVAALGQATVPTTTTTTTTTKPNRHTSANYDESKAGAYTLPDPLTTLSGQKVTDADTWMRVRRPEIIKLFEDDQYGVCPPKPDNQQFLVFDNAPEALGGKAIRKQIMITFGKKPDGSDGPKVHLLMYLPPSAAKEPVPVFLCLTFESVHSIVNDPGVTLTPVWNKKSKSRTIPSESQRGSAKGWPIDTILARGYGVAVMYYGDIEPDFDSAPDGITQGVRGLYLKPGEKDVEKDNDWGSIAAWGWGLSRAQDYLETDPLVDSEHTIILGQSRLGKTVLWAGARDTRFAAVIASCSGEGGAALSRRNFGETVKDMNEVFPYQFSRNYQKYGKHVDQMPVDANLLVALIAPRPLFLNTGSLDMWSDPRGEFLAAVAAGPVYELLGAKSLGTLEYPPYDTPILHDLAFQTHTGKHEILASDWNQFLKFADLHFKPNADHSHDALVPTTAPTTAP